MKPISLSIFAILAASLINIQAEEQKHKSKSFSIPGVVEIYYPSNFNELQKTSNQDILDYANRILKKSNDTPDVKFDQVEILHTASYESGKEYAHVNLTLGPPEITQEEFSEADQDFIGYLTKTMSERIRLGLKSSGNEMIGKANGEKEVLSNGIKAFSLNFTYRMKDDSVRINSKRWIYTKRHTLVIGITTSKAYATENRNTLKQIVESIVVADG